MNGDLHLLPEMDLTYFHTGLLVRSIDAAKQELTRSMGMTWKEPHQSRYGQWDIRVCYSCEGPPFVELIEGGTDGPWGTGGETSRIDHLGYWSEDIERDKRRLEQAGLPIEIDEGHFTYHRAPQAGMRIELIDISRRPGLLRELGLAG